MNIQQKFDDFFNQHWGTLTSQSYSLCGSVSEFQLKEIIGLNIKGLNRLVWYCNNTDKAIPELQKYNACGE